MIYLALFSFILMVFSIFNYFKPLETRIITNIGYSYFNRGQKRIERIYSDVYYIDIKGIYKYLSFEKGQSLKGRWERLVPKGYTTKVVSKKIKDDDNYYYLISNDNYYLNVSKHAYEQISCESKIKSNWKSPNLVNELFKR